MFTGIIEEVGEIKSIQKDYKSAVLTIGTKHITDNLNIGDSVSTNGVCLTVTGIQGSNYTAYVMNETLSRSTLGGLRVGNWVNLERAMSAEGRFGGHMVSGHIDGIGKIVSKTRDDSAIWFKIYTAKQIMRYIVEKGSIAVDGISLTVAKIEADHFMISVIPHTLGNTILDIKKIGDFVNLENDIIGKYIEKFVCIPKGITAEMLV